jgi:hypothetical protein
LSPAVFGIHGTNGASPSSGAGPDGLRAAGFAAAREGDAGTATDDVTDARSAATPLNDSIAAVGSGIGGVMDAGAASTAAASRSATSPGEASHDGSHTRSTTGQRSISPSTSTGRPSRSPTVPRRAHAGPSSSTAITGVSGSTSRETDRSTRNSDNPTSVRTTSPRSRRAAAIDSRCWSTTEEDRASRGRTSVPSAARSR